MTNLKAKSVTGGVRICIVKQLGDAVFIIVAVHLYAPVPILVFNDVYSYIEVESSVIHLGDVAPA